MPYINKLSASMSAGISELKKNPMALIKQGEGQPIAILNRNKPAFYAVPPELFDYLIEVAEDARLLQIAKERKNDETIKVSLDDLRATL